MQVPQFDLTREPGLVGVFRIGWHLVQRIPCEVIQGLRERLGAEDLQTQLGKRAWIAMDLLNAISSDEIDADLKAARFEKVHDVLHMLSLVFEEHAVAHIKHHGWRLKFR